PRPGRTPPRATWLASSVGYRSWGAGEDSREHNHPRGRAGLDSVAGRSRGVAGLPLRIPRYRLARRTTRRRHTRLNPLVVRVHMILPFSQDPEYQAAIKVLPIYGDFE